MAVHVKLDITIYFGSRKFEYRVYVADIADHCILGLHFLRKNNFNVGLEKNEIRTEGEEIPLLGANSNNATACAVVNKERFRIPARLEAIIDGSLKTFESYRYAIIDFPSTVQKGILVAASLIDLQKNVIPIRVLNLDEKPKIIEKGTEIASCKPVMDIVIQPVNDEETEHLKTIFNNLGHLKWKQRKAVKKVFIEFH